MNLKNSFNLETKVEFIAWNTGKQSKFYKIKIYIFFKPAIFLPCFFLIIINSIYAKKKEVQLQNIYVFVKKMSS